MGIDPASTLAHASVLALWRPPLLPRRDPMPIERILLFTLLLLSSRPAAAQWYDPASGQSPMALMAVPEDGVAYYEVKERARALYEGSQWAEVEPLLERLVRDYPRDPENWTMLGRTRFRLRKFR